MIEELDEKKKETLEVTWLKVNKSVYESLVIYYVSQQMHCPFLVQMSLPLKYANWSLTPTFYFYRDFGSIFSTLLPGTMAKLDPPEGGTFLDGLEVRVAFGTVWKQSLSELSGGQRSLLALSLILALLLFKPAPLYILDEVSLNTIFYSN